MSIFADTFAFIAWLNPRDGDHALVAGFFARNIRRIVTTEWVLLELADAFCKIPFRSNVAQFLKEIRTDPQFAIVE